MSAVKCVALAVVVLIVAVLAMGSICQGPTGPQGPTGSQGSPGQCPPPPVSEVLFSNQVVTIGAGEESLPMSLREGDRLSVLLTTDSTSGNVSCSMATYAPLIVPGWECISDSGAVSDNTSVSGGYRYGLTSTNPVRFDVIIPADDLYAIGLQNAGDDNQTVTVFAKRYPSILVWSG